MPVNTNWGPGRVNTNWGPGPKNTKWGPGPVNKNLGPGPVNTNWGPGPGPGTGKYKYPISRAFLNYDVIFYAFRDIKDHLKNFSTRKSSVM